MNDLKDLLADLRDYMAARADASAEPGDDRFRGNAEMGFQQRIEDAEIALARECAYAEKLATALKDIAEAPCSDARSVVIARDALKPKVDASRYVLLDGSLYPPPSQGDHGDRYRAGMMEAAKIAGEYSEAAEDGIRKALLDLPVVTEGEGLPEQVRQLTNEVSDLRGCLTLYREKLALIADIAEGSTTANSLQHIAKIAEVTP